MTRQEEGRYDWHDSSCGGGTWDGFDGLPVTLPCDCGMPDLFRQAFADGLREAKRRLSLAGMHDGKCPEPKKPCNCGLDAALTDPTPATEERSER